MPHTPGEATDQVPRFDSDSTVVSISFEGILRVRGQDSVRTSLTEKTMRSVGSIHLLRPVQTITCVNSTIGGHDMAARSNPRLPHVP